MQKNHPSMLLLSLAFGATLLQGLGCGDYANSLNKRSAKNYTGTSDQSPVVKIDYNSQSGFDLVWLELPADRGIKLNGSFMACLYDLQPALKSDDTVCQGVRDMQLSFSLEQHIARADSVQEVEFFLVVYPKGKPEDFVYHAQIKIARDAVSSIVEMPVDIKKIKHIVAPDPTPTIAPDFSTPPSESSGPNPTPS